METRGTERDLVGGGMCRTVVVEQLGGMEGTVIGIARERTRNVGGIKPINLYRHVFHDACVLWPKPLVGNLIFRLLFRLIFLFAQV